MKDAPMKSRSNKRTVVAAILLSSIVADAGNLIFVGDSTLAPRKPEQRIGSWGDSMADKLKKDWKIVNLATGGATVKSIQNGKPSRWKRALKAAEKGDFVLVQFGINDASPKKLVEVPAFKTEFAKFADAIRETGATPVFCSPVTKGTYGKNGKFIRNASRDIYGAAIREVAAEKKVDFVDMTELSCRVLASMERAAGEDCYVGPKEGKNGKKFFDKIHPSKTGAKRFGEAFIADVKDRNLPIVKIFK